MPARVHAWFMPMTRRPQSAEPLSSFLSNSPSIEDVDTKIQSLQHWITQLQDEIRRLEEYKNTRLLVVSKLPSEVLSTIFEALAFGTISSREEYFQTHYSNLLPATRVCRLWRQVALDSPRIWSSIYNSAPFGLVKVFLERSKSAPLYLLSTAQHVQDKTVSAVLDHIDRLKEIDLPSCECKPEWLERIVCHTAPQLKVISLQGDSLSGMDSFYYPEGGLPTLHHLSLTNYTYKFNTSSLSTLRSLAINCQGMKSPKRRLPNVFEFFAALNELPFLSSLVLIDALAPQNEPISPPSMNLPSLTNLSIQDGDIRNLGMMTCITAPLIQTMKLWTTAQVDSWIAAAVIAAIYLKLTNANVAFTPSLCEFKLSTAITSDDRVQTYARVQVWNDVADAASRHEFTPSFDLYVSGTGNLQTELSVFTLFPPTTPPPIFYFVSDTEAFNYDPLALPRHNILHRLTDITELHADHLIDLALILTDTPESRGLSMSLPSLKKIVLCDTSGMKYKQRILSRLKKQLHARMAVDAGIEIWQLRFTDDKYKRLMSGGKHFTAADLDQFGGLVDLDFVDAHSLH